jgi:CSLREA domain-containing protein
LRARGRIQGTVAAVVAALIVLAVPSLASAQTFPGVFNVDTTRDGNDGECNRDCTLREAVSLATTQGNSISLPAGVYKLALGQLVIRNNTTILGAGFGGNQSAGARTTVIDAQGRSRVLNVPANTGGIIAGVTITGGRAVDGAGVLIGNNGSLSAYNSIIDGNVATGRGGGVDAAAGVFASIGSTISNNQAGVGGGIALDTQANATIFASTISGNTATGPGGGISSVGNIGLQNVTIANNTASTGGAVYVEPTAPDVGSINNTILTAAGGGACGGAFASLPRFGWTGNIAADATCNFAVGEGSNSTDPNLGALRNNKGPTDTMALREGSPAINAGDTNRCFNQDQRGAAAVGTCDIGAFEFGGQVPDPQLPPPVPGETVNASRSKGTVKVKLPGSDEFFVLQDGQQLPMGTTFDTTKGQINLVTAASNVPGATSKGWFYQGVFKVRQSKGRKPLTTLSMTGKLQCGGGGKANAAAKKKRKRRLWGRASGRFRTRGRQSAATVVGTKWLVEDRCNGTLTRVVRGKVKVRDFKRRKTIIVRAGHKYFAKR